MVVIIQSCGDELQLSDNPYEDISRFIEVIPPSPQRLGSVEAGKEYLIYGDYLDSGIPAGLYGLSFGLLAQSNNELNRVGPNAEIAYAYTQVKAFNGVDVVVPNCMQCHAGHINGEFIMGLGNIDFDNTTEQGNLSGLLDGVIKTTYGASSSEYAAYEPFSTAIKATAGQLVTEVVGANSADKLAVVLAAHRNKDDLRWSNNPLTPIPKEVIPADVPAWWLLKKKNAMFSTGIGRQDFARIMMASSVLTLQDTVKAREVDNNFDDVLAYILSLTPPEYPGNINETKAMRGAEIFSETCSKCHGTYGTNETYPNLLVKQEILETDPLLAETNFAYGDFVEWYNGSWFSKGQYGAKIVPTDGYVAPPLDGIWATAPYLHNGSVPTLADLLFSSTRPDKWRRLPGNNEYDNEKLGLKYTKPDTKMDKFTYDTSARGYSNTGHYFGDHLIETDRSDLLEYLKTL
jgi:mono/diheme cytochrome c family protein